MPFVRAILRAPDANAPVMARIARAAGALFVAGFAIFALLLLALRFVVFPRVDDYRGTLTAALSRELGQQVEIASHHGIARPRGKGRGTFRGARPPGEYLAAGARAPGALDHIVCRRNGVPAPATASIS